MPVHTRPSNRWSFTSILTALGAAFLFSAPAAAQSIAIYGPGGDLSAPYFPTGSTYTVISDGTWLSMSAADFAAYDLIWIEADDCEQSIDIQATARETQTTWGPTISGRVAFMSGDLDYHVRGGDARSRDFVKRMVNYLTVEGGTALMLNTGCTARAGAAISRNVADWQPALGSALSDGADRGDYNPTVINGSHPLLADGSSTGIDSLAAFSVGDLAWGNTCHGSIGSYPDGFESVFGRGSDHCLIARHAVVIDRDGDGYGADEDCDDGDSAVYPGAEEVCDGIDNDCDGVIDPDDSTDASTWYADSDGDGYGDPDSATTACDMPSGYVADSSDCDDLVATVNPAATEVCDGIDNDCDGVIDPDDSADASTWYADSDGDGYGDPDSATTACDMPTGYVADGSDCDDLVATVNPAATEICDGIDNDCDGVIDPDDSADAVTWYTDADADGFGDSSTATTSCEGPDGAITDGSDCDDADASINPDAREACDGVDNDCDGEIDGPDSVDATTWYVDADGDGYGMETIEEVCEDDCDTGSEDTGCGEICVDVSDAVSACDKLEGYVSANTDCDDTNPDVYPEAPGLDEDCNAIVDDTGEPADDTGEPADDTGDSDDGSDDDDTATTDDDTGDSDKFDTEECGCATGSMNSGSMWLAILAMVGLARRRHS